MQIIVKIEKASSLSCWKKINLISSENSVINVMTEMNIEYGMPSRNSKIFYIN